MLATLPIHAIDPALERGLALRLRCPRCHQAMNPLRPEVSPHICARCNEHLPCERGVWRALISEREAYYARFVEDYQYIRAQEGRGSQDGAYYLALPDRDLSGRNSRQWAIRARTFRYLERHILPNLTARKNARLRILDLGAGNGWMSYRLARQAHSPVAVDLVANDQDGLEAAEHYVGHLPLLFPRFQAELDNLPFADHQFDVAIFNASFHYSECYENTLGEALRCVRPGGSVIIADTAWYAEEQSGLRMLAERRAFFMKKYGFASNELASQEFLTDQRLQEMEQRFGLTWRVDAPYYGLRWELRPRLAKLRGARTPSQFRIYTATVTK